MFSIHSSRSLYQFFDMQTNHNNRRSAYEQSSQGDATASSKQGRAPTQDRYQGPSPYNTPFRQQREEYSRVDSAPRPLSRYADPAPQTDHSRDVDQDDWPVELDREHAHPSLNGSKEPWYGRFDFRENPIGFRVQDHDFNPDNEISPNKSAYSANRPS